uniref:EGF-like domain-containing protein n=1 Tax=Palpitomonas bilix TaxID=652834 RepID=A0A7S3G710_9EUKA|mmetsp:Transcript_34988/g.90634  ORF Transcript_34988/g.90634 Transcript_34988/m.90634 type:complete len:840 (+) Transcript_34988:331-2850(+)
MASIEMKATMLILLFCCLPCVRAYTSQANPGSPLEVVYAWGKTTYLPSSPEATPQALDAGERYTVGGVGSALATYQTEEGRLYVAGTSTVGELGTGEVSAQHSTPVELTALYGRSVRARSIGLSHTVVSFGAPDCITSFELNATTLVKSERGVVCDGDAVDPTVPPLQYRASRPSVTSTSELAFSNVTFNGDAAVRQSEVDGRAVLSLTPPEGKKKGSIFLTQPIPLSEAFKIDVAFRLGNASSLGGGDEGGDGFVVVLHTAEDGPFALGSEGHDLGIAKSLRLRGDGGLNNSIGIEVDTVRDVGINVRSCEGPYVAAEFADVDECLLGRVPLPVDSILRDGNDHRLVIVYSRGAMDVYLDDVKNPALTIRIVIDSLIPLFEGGKGYFGMSAATGESFESHEVISVKFEQLGRQGTLVGWGSNLYGQLATDVSVSSLSSPSTILAFSLPAEHWQAGMRWTEDFVVDVAAGDRHTLVCTDKGWVYVWGENKYGQLGLPTRGIVDTPRLVTELAGVVKVAAGAFFSMALTNASKIYAWGDNTEGQVGTGTEGGFIYTPSELVIPVALSPSRIFAGGYHAGFVDDGGNLYLWGSNSRGQLGLTGVAQRIPQPRLVPLPGPVDMVSLGRMHSVVLIGGQVYASGSNYFGQLGTGDRASRREFTLLSHFFNRTVANVMAGEHATLAFSYCDGKGFHSNGTCVCQHGIKGGDCSTYCPTALNPSDPTAVEATVCGSHGRTRETNVFTGEIIFGEDCEDDGNCVCEAGFVGTSCEVACVSTLSRRFNPEKQCACLPLYSGLFCDVKQEEQVDWSAISAAPRLHSTLFLPRLFISLLFSFPFLLFHV